MASESGGWARNPFSSMTAALDYQLIITTHFRISINVYWTQFCGWHPNIPIFHPLLTASSPRLPKINWLIGHIKKAILADAMRSSFLLGFLRPCNMGPSAAL
jgi:hypothetical protein